MPSSCSSLGVTNLSGATVEGVRGCDPGNADIALNGNILALMCTCAFFREDHLLYGSGRPYDFEKGAVRQTIEAMGYGYTGIKQKEDLYELWF